MKAAWYDRYGDADVVGIRDVAMPEVGENDVLVKVHASSVTTADWRMRASAFPGVFWLPGRLMVGLFSPRNHVLGGDFAGRVVATGQSVARFGDDDAVFGFALRGAHAQYLVINADAAIAAMPEGLNFDQAAAVPFGALSALVFLRDFAQVRRGEKVLVIGASGGVGVYATQLARVLGADVTGLCSDANQDLVRDLGADHVIDYRKEDFTRAATQYDVILDTVGATDFASCKAALSEVGRFIPLEFGLREVWQSLLTSRSKGRRVLIGVSGDSREDLEYLSDLLERQEIKPVIDQCLPLEQIAEAHRRVESRHKTGALVVTVSQDRTAGNAPA